MVYPKPKDGNSSLHHRSKDKELYEPQNKWERWLVAIACAFFFPLVYFIGRAIIYLFG